MTFLDPHGVPSGGDWALQRSAAVFVEGAEAFHAVGCNFTHLDGNALMISGYNRDATIENSTFVSTGSSAIALWGYTNGTADGQPEGTVRVVFSNRRHHHQVSEVIVVVDDFLLLGSIVGT